MLALLGERFAAVFLSFGGIAVFIFTLLMAASSWGLDGENWPDSVQHSPYDNPYPPYFSDSTGTIYDSIGSGPVVTVPDSTYNHGEGPALPDLNVFLEIDDIPNETYSGDSICPAPVIIVPDSIDPLDENTDYKVYCSNNLNAGEATLVVEGIGKYTGKIEKTFYIEKASLIVRALNDTITYGDELSIASVEYSGFVGNDNENDLNDSLTFSYDYAQYDNVGKYTIIPSGPRSENYEIEFVEGELTVEPKVISIVWDDKDTSFTYDGKAHAPNATAENLLNDDECNVVIDSATNAGKYTAKAIDLSNKNYKLPKILNGRSFEERSFINWKVTKSILSRSLLQRKLAITPSTLWCRVTKTIIALKLKRLPRQLKKPRNHRAPALLFRAPVNRRSPAVPAS